MSKQKTSPASAAPVSGPRTLSKIRIFLGLFLVLMAGVMAVSFISFLLSWQADQSQAGHMLDRSAVSTNLFGKIGDWLGTFFIFNGIGIAALLLAFFVAVVGLLVLRRGFRKPWKVIGHLLFFICWLPIFFGAITKGNGTLSGVYGFQISDFLRAVTGSAGLWLIVIASLLLYFILEFNLRPSAIRRRWAQISGALNRQRERLVPASAEQFEADEELLAEEHTSGQNQKEDLANNGAETPIITPIKTPSELRQAQQVEQHGNNLVDVSTGEVISENTSVDFSDEDELNNDVNDFFEDNEEKPVEIPIDFGQVSTPAAVHSVFPLPVAQPAADDVEVAVAVAAEDEAEDDKFNSAEALVQKIGPYDHKLDLPRFQMPNIEILKDYGSEEISVNHEELEENNNRIKGLLKTFNIGISEIKATIGPTVTLYEIVPEAGIRVASIKKLQDDIALNLSALGIRIIAPMPGKGTIGIEVPRKNPTMVSMRSVIGSKKFQNADMELPIVFGKTISNEIFMADLAKMPHLLMAGATGQGKSVGINAILTSLLWKRHPSELKLVLVDPKKVELSLYAKIERHYLAKLPETDDAILTDTSKVINTLNSLCVEMDQRYDLLKNAFCRNLKEYNQKFKERKLNPENGHRYLPYIVLIVDEFADLIMTAGKEVEHPIARLAQLARAVGIHLIVATQRPSVNVITGMIKANFPARVSFRVNSSIDSRTILDSTGAEQLIGRGDMLYSNGNDLIRMQCAFVDTPEVERLVDFIGEQKGYPSAMMLPEVAGEDSLVGPGSFDPNERDALFEEAARIVVGTQQGSTSSLQRQLKLGYNRAGRIMDQLEAAGIVGGFNGAKAREVLLPDVYALEEFLKNL